MTPMTSLQLNNRNQALSNLRRLQERVDEMALDMLEQLDQMFAGSRIAPKHLRFAAYDIISGRYLVFWLDTRRLYNLPIKDLISADVTDRLSTVPGKPVRASYAPEFGLTYSIDLTPHVKPVMPTLPKVIKYDLDSLRPDRPLCAPFGVTTAGPQMLDLGGTPTHILVAGGSQTGKSSWTQILLTSLACFNTPQQVQFAIADPKGEFVHWYDAPHLSYPVAKTAGEALQLLANLIDLYNDRRKKFEAVKARNHREYADKTGQGIPLQIVLIDEFVDIIEDGGRGFLSLLKQLATKSASYNIKLVMTTASPKADVIDSTVRAQCDIRLCFRVNEPTHSEMVLGPGRREAKSLPAIQGRFLAVLPGQSDLITAQSYYIDGAQLDRVQADLQRLYRPVPAREAVIDGVVSQASDAADDPDSAEPVLTVSADELEWLRWAVKYGEGRFNVSRVSAKFNITNNARNPVRALGIRLEREGWLQPGESPTKARLISDKLSRELQKR